MSIKLSIYLDEDQGHEYFIGPFSASPGVEEYILPCTLASDLG
jgi:hypothetical protein